MNRESMLATFLLALALFILLPCVQTAIPFIRVPTVDEYRKLSPPPKLSLLTDGGAAAFTDAVSRWFDDHLGLRDLFIRVKNQIDYSVFDTSHKVYLGRDGWLFDRERTDDRFEIERLDEQDFLQMEQSFHQLGKMLKERGVTLVLVGYPDKAMTYPKYLPYDAPKSTDGGNLGRLRKSLENDPSIIFIDVEKVLLPLKDGPPLFYRTDLHPTLHTAIPVVREIVRRIAAAEHRPEIAWHENVHWQAATYRAGGEARFLALLKSSGEQIDAASRLDGVGGTTNDGRWLFDSRIVDYSFGQSPVFRWAFKSKPSECADRLPGTMLWGDSFSDPYELLWMPHYFCFMRRAKTPIERLLPFIADMPAGTKYFIYQFVETYLPCEAPLIGKKLSHSYSCTM